jgi:hypothetical protein
MKIITVGNVCILPDFFGIVMIKCMGYNSRQLELVNNCPFFSFKLFQLTYLHHPNIYNVVCFALGVPLEIVCYRSNHDSIYSHVVCLPVFSQNSRGREIAHDNISTNANFLWKR